MPKVWLSDGCRKRSDAGSGAITSMTTPTTVPVPGAVWLLASGLGALGLRTRRNPHNVLMQDVSASPPGHAPAVLDTNVLLALWLFRDPVVEPLRAALATGELRAFRSAATDAEFAEVLGRPALFSVAPERQAALLATWQAASSLVEAIQPAPWVCRDPLDQKFLDLAVSAGANWLITRDRDLLKLARKARRQALVIVTPARWLEVAGLMSRPDGR